MRSWSLVLGVVCWLAGPLPALADENVSPSVSESPVAESANAELENAAQAVPALESSSPDALASETSTDAVEAPIESASDSALEADALEWDQLEGASLDAELEAEPEALLDAEPGASQETESQAALEAPLAEDLVPAAPVQTFEEQKPVRSNGILLGPIRWDEAGRRGRLHTVSRGDTLWDISEAYLGTPWVWPSVWIENDEIANPHLINPGDLIWITSNEMRRVTPEQAEELSTEPVDVPAASEPELDFAFEDSSAPLVEEPVEPTVSLPMNQMPVSVPLQGGSMEETGRVIRVSSREQMSFISSQALAAASSIVDSPDAQTWLTDSNLVFLGLGEGEVEVGDQFTIFRDVEAVRDVHNEALLGYHVRVLGWAEVNAVHPETATAEIRLSSSEIHRGDRIIPREAPPTAVVVREAPDDVRGQIVYMPDSRTTMGSVDYVYLNVGSIHGVEVGTALQVFTPGRVKSEPVRHTTVQTPDHPMAELVVVSLKPDSCVAFVVKAMTELEVGYPVKGSS